MCQLNIKQDLGKSSPSKWFKWKFLNFFFLKYWLWIAQYPKVEKKKRKALYLAYKISTPYLNLKVPETGSHTAPSSHCGHALLHHWECASILSE